MVQAFQAKGEWWLPDAERGVPGVLSVSETGASTLELIGSFRDEMERGKKSVDLEKGVTTVSVTEESLADSGIYPRIHGQAGGKPYTLRDCFRGYRSSPFFGGLATETVHVGQVFQGVLLEDDDPQFNEMWVEFRWLPYWVMETGLDESHFFEGEDGDSAQYFGSELRVKRIESRKLPAPDGGTVVLYQTSTQRGDCIVERSYLSGFGLCVEHDDPASLDQLMDQVSDLQDVVAMGTNRIATFEQVTLRRADVGMTGPNQKFFQTQIGYTAEWSAVDESEPKRLWDHEMFFTLPDIGGMEGLERLLGVAVQHRHTLGRIMGTRYSPKMYVSDRLLNVAAALEGYHREATGDEGAYLRDRYRECADKAGEVFEILVGDVDAWTLALKNRRHDLAHNRRRHERGGIFDYVLADSGYWLFVLCFLQDAKAPSTAFDRMRNHQQFRWLSRHLAKLLPPAGGS